jgi:hypothetical protein
VGIGNDSASGTTQIKDDLQSLNSALQAGDITTAQQALVQLQKDDPKLASASSFSSSAAVKTAS